MAQNYPLIIFESLHKRWDTFSKTQRRILSSPPLLFLMFILSIPFLANAQYSNLSPREALKTIFFDSKEIISEKKVLNPSQRASIEKKLGASLKTNWTFYVAHTGKKVDGYAIIDHEIGKTEPITFLTAILPSGKIKAVEILAYREPVGGEVREKRFLKQYQLKSSKDPIRTGQDIQNITGATLSSRAVSLGVKRALVLWEFFYDIQ